MNKRTWWPEFDLCNLHSRRREPAFGSCLLTSTHILWHTHTPVLMHTYKINITNLFFFSKKCLLNHCMPSFACPGSSFPWAMCLGGGRAMIQTLMCLCQSSPLVPACVAVLVFLPHPLCLSPICYAMVASLQSGSALQFWQSCLCLWLRNIMVHSSLATLPFHGPLCLK